MILAAWYHPILAVLFAFLAVFMMLVILLQRGKGVGLAGAFGGAGGQTAFGSKTGDVLTWATVVIAGVFFLLTIGLNYVFVPEPAGLQPAAVSPTPGTTGEVPPPGALPPSPVTEPPPAQPGPTEAPAGGGPDTP